MNIIMIAGTLGADSELRYTQAGVAVSRIRVATDHSWLDKEGKKCKETEWHRCTIWAKRAEGLHPHLVKGLKVTITGRVKTSSYDDTDGNKKYSSEIVVTDILLQGGPRQGGDGGDQAQPQDRQSSPARSNNPPPPEDDDIPF